MFSPPDPFYYFPWEDLRIRMARSVRSASADDQIFETVRTIFDKALVSENILLSAPERDRLLRSVMKDLLAEMLTKLDGKK